MGPRDYGCGCPRGYRRLEGGHCLAINSISSYNRFGGGGGAPMEELDYTSGMINVRFIFHSVGNILSVTKPFRHKLHLHRRMFCL